MLIPLVKEEEEMLPVKLVSPKEKEIITEYSLEELMLKLKFQYFGHPMQRTDSLEKTVMLGKIDGRRKGDGRG